MPGGRVVREFWSKLNKLRDVRPSKTPEGREVRMLELSCKEASLERQAKTPDGREENWLPLRKENKSQKSKTVERKP